VRRNQHSSSESISTKGYEIAVKHIVGFGTQDIRQPAGHAGTEIQAKRSEDDGHAAGHVLATVLADTLDDGKRTAVPDSEAFSGTASNKELARGSAIEHRVAARTSPRLEAASPAAMAMVPPESLCQRSHWLRP